MSYKVGSKGQVVIDREIREALGIEPGYVAVQRRVGDRVEMRFFPAEHERSLKGILAGAVTREPAGEWADISERAWADAAREADEG